ncbi:uncharacterized protein A1O9_06050 [Exophiala aquamarina CBS 119918]|uniref:BZIP domain-containing protein n=1 Tax=Exophiala aquamarina CBS 119918 TaxID=1182545 RepID=A0A072PED1_9EURO|nr:uncharacterized protein A1O9_06050 [Exophiala aquamarina CBS 119918]KEF58127.1 hypothetical protein A1O9_06050 [Exophiala aquamarina CBS 119918]
MTTNKSQPKRKAEQIELPSRGEDASERKRVLNVLAQRRYRQRKKEHVQKLEAQVQPSDRTEGRDQQKSSQSTDLPPGKTSASPLSSSPTHGGTSQYEPTMTTDVPAIVSEDFDESSFDPTACFSAASPGQFQKEFLNQGSVGQSDLFQDDPFAMYDINSLAFPVNSQSFWDMSLGMPSISNSPQSSTTASSSNGSASWSLTPVPIADEADNATVDKTGKQLSPRPQADGLQYCFPDEATLEVLELTLLRGCMMVARRIDVHEIMWSLTASSPFTDPSMAFAQYKHLPTNLQPSMVQLTVPHHPILDILPWPAVRDRMIMILAQPPEARPPQAASPTALLDFVYDIEDSSEGVRISGSDPYSANNWEVGEKVFNSWWWIFDRDVVRRSNELRKSRGAPLLGSSGTPGSILGELA